MRVALFFLICGIVFGGLVTSSSAKPFTDNNGHGPIILTPRAMADYGVYSNKERPHYFALADDGKSAFYTYTPIGNSLYRLEDGGEVALRKCNKHAKKRGVKCSLLASDRQIIWDGPIFYAGNGSDYLFTLSKEVRGRNRNYFGKGIIMKGGGKIAFKNKKCRGKAILKTKKWFIKRCKNGFSAKGTFVAGEGMVKYQGIGISNEGGDVIMQLLDPFSDPIISKATKQLTDTQICKAATIFPKKHFSEKWRSGPASESYSQEAKRRGLSLKDCWALAKPSKGVAQPPANASVENRLAKLKRLLDKGLLTPEEESKKRKEILNSL